MKGSSTMRRWLLALALTATVAAAGWVRSKEQNGVVVASSARNAESPQQAEPPQRRADAENPGAAGSTIGLERLSQRPVARNFGEMFHPRSWQPPPPPVSARAPERPTAPPLPFRFFGRLVEDGRTVVFLDRQDEIYAAKVGDTIGGTYRVEEIKGTEVVLTYLPLKQRQTLQIGTIN
jgi:hypothetical protein